jgi:hypothetical protein
VQAIGFLDVQLMIGSLYKAIRRSARPLKRMWLTRSNAIIFDQVYKNKLWGVGSDPNAPFYSGIGSYDPCVPDYVDLVKSIIKKYNVRSVTEIGCGDFAVASQYVDACSDYLGIDVVKRLVDRNSRMFASDRVRFICKDPTASFK